MKNKHDSDLNQILISHQEMRLYFFFRFSHPCFLNWSQNREKKTQQNWLCVLFKYLIYEYHIINIEGNMQEPTSNLSKLTNDEKN